MSDFGIAVTFIFSVWAAANALLSYTRELNAIRDRALHADPKPPLHALH
jgi:hypothetical protein